MNHQPTSRRQFLAMVGLGAAAAATATPFALQLLGDDPALDLLNATAETFRPHIGETFNVAGQSVRRVTLVDVRERGDRAFSLFFDGNEGLAQGTYPLRHATLGRFDLFVVPGRMGEAVVSYEAAFNHGGT